MSDAPGNLTWHWVDPPGRTPWFTSVEDQEIPTQALLDLATIAQDPAPVEWSGLLQAACIVHRCLAVREWARLPLVIGTLSLELGIPLSMGALTALLDDARAVTVSYGTQAGFTALAHRFRVLCES